MSNHRAASAAYYAGQDAGAVAGASERDGAISLALGAAARAVADVAEFAGLAPVASALTAADAVRAVYATFQSAERAWETEQRRQDGERRLGTHYGQSSIRDHEEGGGRGDFHDAIRRQDAMKLAELKAAMVAADREVGAAMEIAAVAWEQASQAIDQAPELPAAPAARGRSYTSPTMRGWAVMLAESQGSPRWCWTPDVDGALPLSSATPQELALPVLYCRHPSAGEGGVPPKQLRYCRTLANL